MSNQATDAAAYNRAINLALVKYDREYDRRALIEYDRAIKLAKAEYAQRALVRYRRAIASAKARYRRAIAAAEASTTAARSPSTTAPARQ